MVGLIIFQKNAVLGKVKTRLAATVGDEKALEVYQWLTDHTHRVVSELRVDKFIYFSDFIPDGASELFPTYGFAVQRDGDLGERMAGAFSDLFVKGYRHVAIIGTDCPELHPSDLRDAYLALNDHDLVVGPARDGGYYLLGMNRPQSRLFQGIPWSTSEVLPMTLDRANADSLDYEFLQIHADVDTWEDWELFCQRRKMQEF